MHPIAGRWHKVREMPLAGMSLKPFRCRPIDLSGGVRRIPRSWRALELRERGAVGKCLYERTLRCADQKRKSIGCESQRGADRGGRRLACEYTDRKELRERHATRS